MRCTFDSAKNAKNLEVHGVALAEAQFLEWGEMIAAPDDRQDYGEVRYRGYAPRGARLYCVVYTDRVDGRRIISLRKANSREVARYEQAQAD